MDMSDKSLLSRLILALGHPLSVRAQIKEAREHPQNFLAMWIFTGKLLLTGWIVGAIAIAIGYGIARIVGPNHWLGSLLLNPTKAEIYLVFTPIGLILAWLTLRLAMTLGWVRLPKRNEREQ
jgi:hypothetical protein